MRKLFIFILLILFSCNDPIVYTLTATADPEEGGQVVPEYMEYGEGDTAYVLATPSEEYVLESWSGDASGNANINALRSNADALLQNVMQRQPPQ